MDIQLATDTVPCIDTSTTSKPFQDYHSNLKEIEQSKRDLECAQKELQAAEQLLTLSTVVGGDTSQLTSAFQDVAIYYRRLVNEIVS